MSHMEELLFKTQLTLKKCAIHSTNNKSDCLFTANKLWRECHLSFWQN